MDLKVGDRVLIKSREWYDENKDRHGYIWNRSGSFTPGMSNCLGKTFIVKAIEGFPLKFFSIENSEFLLPLYSIERILDREGFIKPGMLTYNELPSLFSHKTDVLDALSLGCYVVHSPSFWKIHSDILSQSTEEVKLINPHKFLKLDV